MVSSVLAQAILGQEAPDILGAFEEGREKARTGEVRRLSGLAVGGDAESLTRLTELDPEIGLTIAEKIGARDAKTTDRFLAYASIGAALANSGDIQGAIKLAQQGAEDMRQSGANSGMFDQMAETLRVNPAMGLEQLNALQDSIEGSKGMSVGLQEFQSHAQNLTPEEVELARRIELGLDPRAMGSAVQTIEVQGTADRIAGVEQTLAKGKAIGTETGKLETQFRLKPRVESAVKTAVAAATQHADIAKEDRSNRRALEVYEIAIKGLADALGQDTTGPFVGLLPALTQEARTAEGAIALMAPVLKSIFRTAGEGTFTDQDQALLMGMVPSRRDKEATARTKLENIDLIVRAKLGKMIEEVQAPQAGQDLSNYSIISVQE